MSPRRDLDGDGFEDVIVAAFQDRTVGPAARAAYVLYGPISPASSTWQRPSASPSSPGTSPPRASPGWEIWTATASTTSSSGRPGACRVSLVPFPGAGYVFYGGKARLDGSMSLAEADAKLTGEAVLDLVGLSVASATDLDDDGFDDLVVSGAGNDAAGVGAGAVYVLYGGDDRLSGTVGLADADAKLVGAPGDVAGSGSIGRATSTATVPRLVVRSHSPACPWRSGVRLRTSLRHRGPPERNDQPAGDRRPARRGGARRPAPGSGSPGQATWTTTASTT